jgi:hypothetical protein
MIKRTAADTVVRISRVLWAQIFWAIVFPETVTIC